jgi:hypothetical protein
MPLKSFQKGKRTLATTDTAEKIVTGKVEEYRSSSYFGTKVQDPDITFKYYRYGAYMGTTRFYWHDISAGTLNELSVSSSNGNSYQPMTTQHHTNTGQTWLTGTINLSSYEGTGYGRLVVRHQTSSDGSNFFTGDFQMDHIEIHSAIGETINLDPDLFRQSSSNQFWQRSNYNTTWSAGMTWTDLAYLESSDNFWCYDSGGTGSSNTGDTVNSDGSGTEYYIYTEVSGGSSRYCYLQTKYEYDLFSGASQ